MSGLGGMDDEERRSAPLDDDALEASSVVANCAMNRERQLAGVNSYTRELGFNPINVVLARITDLDGQQPGQAARVAWLDLCCGSGWALTQAADQLRQIGRADRVVLVGVDLVDTFAPTTPTTAGLELVCASVATWAPSRSFDLITCVHGLHYVGDKLAVLTRAAGWLTETGQLVADLDLASVRLADGRPAGRRLGAQLRAAGFSYDARRRRIRCSGRREVHLPYRYLGADDRAGSNYTGQPAVRSHYAEIRLSSNPTADRHAEREPPNP